MTEKPDQVFASSGFSTRCIHGGEYVDSTTRASSPNLVMSSTFVVDQPVAFSATAADVDDRFVYTRWSNPTVRQLEKKLALLEGGEDCQCFASGMGAASAVLLGLLSHGDHVVMSDTNYPGVAELARNTLPRFGIAVSRVDTSDVSLVESAMRDTTRLVWIETPANPILKLSDVAGIADVAHRFGALLAVDSTFATPVATCPLALGADIVMHSLSKYLGGHGDALGGAIIASGPIVARLRQESAIHHGGVLSPFNAWLIIRGLSTLGIRMSMHESNAKRVARFLEAHPAVTRVIYPGLESHPQFELASLQMRNFSGMISFQVKQGRSLSRCMMQTLKFIHYAVSLGHHRSLIYWMDTRELIDSSFGLSGKALARYREFAGDGVFRLSVGLEDVADLEADLSRCLDTARSPDQRC